MLFETMFWIKSVLLGIGLAMDAFSVSLANGLNEPCMRKRKMFGIAGTFAFFQALMPLLGWLFVHTILQYFDAFGKFIPWIALVLLCYIGGKMLAEGIKNEDVDPCLKQGLGFLALIVQGIATSIDALSCGFTIANYTPLYAIICALVISLVTFLICTMGVLLGRKIGTKLSGKASILGGVILIVIGIEIFITGII
ncbi:MAG: manganese efflux pump [Clostridia bacterium]|nr:manganese efflux pump [Clostridia bacterium]